MRLNKYNLGLIFFMTAFVNFLGSEQVVNAQYLDIEKQKKESYEAMLRQEKSLRPLGKIIILKSTREEVRRFLDGKIRTNQSEDIIENKNGEYRIDFVDGDCASAEGKALEDGTVYSISVFLKKKIRFSKFWIPHQMFVVHQEEDAPQILRYVSKDLGVELTVQNDLLEDVSISPSDNLGIKCGD